MPEAAPAVASAEAIEGTVAGTETEIEVVVADGGTAAIAGFIAPAGAGFWT
jgi:hypothetical protein